MKKILLALSLMAAIAFPLAACSNNMDKIESAAKETMSDVGNVLEDTGNAIGQEAKQIESGIEDAAKDAGNAISKETKKVESDVKDAYDDAKKDVSKQADKIEDELESQSGLANDAEANA